MTPAPPPWCPDASATPGRLPGSFHATVPAKGEGGLHLPPGMDEREAANQMAACLRGQHRADAQYGDASEVVGIYNDGRWRRPGVRLLCINLESP